MLSEGYDEADVAPHEYRPCEGRRCNVVVRDAHFCKTHDPIRRIRHQIERLTILYQLTASLVGVRPEALDELQVYARLLGLYSSALSMKLRRRDRTARRYTEVCG